MFKRFNAIDPHNINFDFHIHTKYTDGKNSMEEMVQKALKLNFKSIAITDHTRESSDYFNDYFNEINLLKNKYKINILNGAEARISDFSGNISYPKQIKKDLDILIASVHRISINDNLFSLNEFSPNIAMEIEKLLSIEAIKKAECNVLGHCGGMSIHFFDEFPITFFEDIIKTCKKHDVAFEINSRYHKKYYAILFNLLKKHNPYITFGSDAHCTEEMRRFYYE